MGREKVDVVGGKRMGVERGRESILRRGSAEGASWSWTGQAKSVWTIQHLHSARSHGGPERELCDLPPAGVRQQQQQQQQWSE